MIRVAKILSALAVSSGIFSIIGTGFGAWIFSNNGNYNVDVFLSGLQIEIGTDAELGHFRNQEADYYYEPHILVFDEGTNPTDLNDGLSFYKEQEHPVLGEGVTAPVRDDELEIIFHKDANFNEVEYGLKFQIGASIELISDEAATSELNNFIQISDYLYNTQINDVILQKSTEFNVNFKKGFNLLMVSRLEKEKAHLRFLPIVKKLHEEGIEFNLNIVGGGSLKQNIESYVAENNMQEYVTLYGEQKNPYPYFKEADLFVLVSLYESFGISLIEAMLLSTPVFTTKTCSANEVVGNYGFICENNEQAIYDNLKQVLKNKQWIEEKKKLITSYNYDNDKIVQKLLNLI